MKKKSWIRVATALCYFLAVASFCLPAVIEGVSPAFGTLLSIPFLVASVVFDIIRVSVVHKEKTENEEPWEVTYRRRCCEKSTKELAKLDDDKLMFTVEERVQARIDSFGEGIRGMEWLNESQHLFYAIYLLESEVYENGLCAFFAHESRAVAPLVSEYMEKIGAHEHKRLYDAFVAKHHIDLNDLSAFDIASDGALEEERKRLPYAEFEEPFCELELLHDHLVKYVRAHLEDF